MTRGQIVSQIHALIIERLQESFLDKDQEIRYYEALPYVQYCLADLLNCLRDLSNAGTRPYELDVAKNKATEILDAIKARREELARNSAHAKELMRRYQ